MEYEIWKDILGYENKYKISNLGNIKSLNYSGHGYEKSLKPSKNKNGYLNIVLNKKSFYIHRLVCLIFIPNPQSLPQVNHKNGNRTDNRIENLEWVTNKENSTHKIKVLKYVHSEESKLKASINHNKKVIKYDLDDNIICEYNSISEVSKLLNINSTSISYCCHEIRKTAGGYKWKFK